MISCANLKNKILAGLSLALFMTGSLSLTAAFGSMSGKNQSVPVSGTRGQQAEMLGEEEAKAIALERAGLNSDEVRFTKTELEYDDQVPEYDIRFMSSDKEYEFEILAETGVIAEYSFEVINRALPNADSSADNTGEEKAEEIALTYTGYTKDQITIRKAELEQEDGRLVYEVEFKADGMEFEFDILAADGTIIKYSQTIIE